MCHVLIYTWMYIHFYIRIHIYICIHTGIVTKEISKFGIVNVYEELKGDPPEPKKGGSVVSGSSSNQRYYLHTHMYIYLQLYISIY
jgi:hypothetical protein